jgi:hypothetical protein
VGGQDATERDRRARTQIRWVGWSLSLALILQLVVYTLPMQVNAPPLVGFAYQPWLTVLAGGGHGAIVRY